MYIYAYVHLYMNEMNDTNDQANNKKACKFAGYNVNIQKLIAFHCMSDDQLESEIKITKNPYITILQKNNNKNQKCLKNILIKRK